MYNFAAYLPNPPDPTRRVPTTIAAFGPLFLSYNVLSVLVLLPHTRLLRISILPFVLWQAWKCAIGLNYAEGLAQSLGLPNGDRMNCWNFAYVIGMFVMSLRSIEWAFAPKPFRRYEPSSNAAKPVERPLTLPNILLDAFDLQCNQRGVRWSWSHKPFPPDENPPPSLLTILYKIIVKLVVFDISHYLIQYNRPSLDDIAGGTLFDPTLDPIPRFALALFFTLCGGVVVYTTVDAMYLISMLVGRVLLRQPASQWPRLANRPWLATSITEFWSFRWHQSFRHTFTVFGARPGGALFGRPGALFGAFAVSAVMHDVGMWGLGHGTEFRTAGGFFVFMGVGAALEGAFARATGRRVRGVWGWAWTMLWTLGWGTLMFDAWARRGMIASDFYPQSLRPGKALVDSIIAVSQHLR
ncbi:hypothetical protein BC834DRAFT_822135 [Gloeopeniophorella convolvens]|nr:hypothetical protein BC834DRAFT_822135 [Gloeopeniophorella convolvens]